MKSHKNSDILGNQGFWLTVMSGHMTLEQGLTEM